MDLVALFRSGYSFVLFMWHFADITITLNIRYSSVMFFYICMLQHYYYLAHNIVITDFLIRKLISPANDADTDDFKVTK